MELFGHSHEISLYCVTPDGCTPAPIGTKMLMHPFIEGHSKNPRSIGHRDGFHEKRIFRKSLREIRGHLINLRHRKRPAQHLDDWRNCLLATYFEHESRFARNCDTELCEKRHKFGRVAVPRIFQHFSCDVIGTIRDSLIETPNKLFNSLRPSARSLRGAHQFFQKLNISFDHDSAQVVNGPTIRPLAEWLELHHPLLSNTVFL